MKSRLRVPLALAALAAAASLSACEHYTFSEFMFDSVSSMVEESLTDQDCDERYAGDPPGRSLCDFQPAFDDGDDW